MVELYSIHKHIAEHKLCTPNPMVYQSSHSLEMLPSKGLRNENGGPFQPGQSLCELWQVAGREELFHGRRSEVVLQGDLGHFPRSPEKWAIDSWKMFDFFGRPRKSKCLEDPSFLNGKKLREHRNNT